MAGLRPSKQRPDARKHHDSRPLRMRLLAAQTQIPIVELAAMIGVSRRTMFAYLADTTPQSQWAPYSVQVVLEQVVAFQARVIGRREKRRTKAAGA